MKNEPDISRLLDQRKLVWGANFFVCGFVLILGLLRYVLSDLHEPPYPALVVAASCFCNGIYSKKGGDTRRSAWLLIVVMWIGLLYGGLYTYGFDGPVILLAPLVPILAVLLINFGAALISLLIVALILLAIFLAAVTGYLPTNPYPDHVTNFAKFITTISLCSALVWVVWRFSLMVKTLLVEIDGLSKTDYLTGVLNRRGIEFVLSNDVARARRNNSWLSIIIIDIDHFKRFNDLNGHQAGDRCLVLVCNKIQECLRRSSDVLGRYGGEEFIVVLPDVDTTGAAQVAENIRFAVESEKTPYAKGLSEHLTLTLGVAGGRGQSIESSDQMVKLADNMLYDGKRSGKNRVSVESLTPTPAASLDASQQ